MHTNTPESDLATPTLVDHTPFASDFAEGREIVPLETENMSPERHEATSFKFVFWRHVPENAKAAAGQLADCDVVAIEFVGCKNADERQRYDNAATLFVSSAADAKERAKAEKALRKMPPSTLPLLRELRGSDKQIVSIDMMKSDPGYDKFKAAMSHEMRLGFALGQQRPNEAIAKKIMKNDDFLADQIMAREELLSRQLHNLANAFAPGTKIGVMLGAIHTPVYHELQRSYQAERVFIDNEQPQPMANGELYRYSPAGRLLRQRRMLPDSPITEALLNRVLLEGIELVAQDENNPSAKGAPLHDSLDDAEVSEILAEIDMVKNGVVAKLRGRKWRREQVRALIDAKGGQIAKQRGAAHAQPEV